MTVNEIYERVSAHMIKGMMIHDNLANYYDFLGLCGYKRCHEYHFLSETCNFRKLNSYFINHHNMLIKDVDITPEQVIPDSWYQINRLEVDNATKKTAVKNALGIWHKWEKDTKKLYEQMYKELLNINEVASAMFFKRFICDVDKELKKVEKYYLNKQAIEYDLGYIFSEQHEKHEKYKCKTKKVGEKYA